MGKVKKIDTNSLPICDYTIYIIVVAVVIITMIIIIHYKWT